MAQAQEVPETQPPEETKETQPVLSKWIIVRYMPGSGVTVVSHSDCLSELPQYGMAIYLKEPFAYIATRERIIITHNEHEIYNELTKYTNEKRFLELLKNAYGLK